MKHLKQTIAILLTLLMIVTAVPFSVFGLTEAQKTCKHDWTSKDFSAGNMASPANCVSAATYYLICTKCGANAKDVPEAKDKVVADPTGKPDPNAHPEDKLKVTKAAVPATCKTAGETEEKTCTLCGKVAVESTLTPSDPNAHVAADGTVADCTKGITCVNCGKTLQKDPNKHPKDKVQVVVKGTAATCGTDGKTDTTFCTACNKTVDAGTTIPATGKHTEKTAATCSKKAVCSVCNKEYGDFDTTKHNLEKHDAVAVSCTTDGKKEYWQCKDCKKIFSDDKGTTETTEAALVIKADGKSHDLEKVAEKKASCSAEGNIEYWHCKTCDHYYKDQAATQSITKAETVVEKAPHTWGKMTLVEGNCEKGGKATHECSVCKTKEDVVIVAGQHPVDAQKTTKGKAATCTEAGSTDEIACELCGTKIQVSTEIAALGHDYTGAAATGKGDGTHTFACIRCKEPGAAVACVDDDKDCKCDICKQQLAHVFTNYVSDNNATCAEDGTKTAICDVCGKGKDTVKDEGSKALAAHDYEWTELNDATCLANGHRKGVCKVCGAETMEEITDTALGHEESDWLYPEGFDCTVGGNRYKKCTRCGETMTTEAIEGRAHSEVIDPEVPRTCTTDGKSAGSHCDVCGKIITPQAIFKAEGHKADENGFTTVAVATCTTDGSKKAKCGVCGQDFTETIPAIGHSYVDTVVKPTCEGSGYTLHKCSICGDEKKENISSPTGHKMKETIKPATMDANGKVVQTCSVCGKKVVDKVYKIKKIALSQMTYARTSKKNTPKVVVTDSKGNKLQKNVDYTVKYASGRKAVGTYKVVVTFKGEYSGKKTLKFKVVPPVVKNVKVKAGTRSASLTWDRNKFADVYVIYRATTKNGKFKKIASTNDLGYTVTGLTSGKVYYFKVRAVRKLDTGNYYSADSAIKKVTVK